MTPLLDLSVYTVVRRRVHQGVYTEGVHGGVHQIRKAKKKRPFQKAEKRLPWLSAVSAGFLPVSAVSAVSCWFLPFQRYLPVSALFLPDSALFRIQRYSGISVIPASALFRN